MENGFTRIPNKLLLSNKLKVYEKIVLIILIAYRMDNEDCFPSRETISKNAGINIKTVDFALKSLEEKRFLTSTFIKGKTKRYKISNSLKIKSVF